MPICHDANDSNDSSPEVDDVKINQTLSAQQTFNFMCNLKEKEYQGYVKLAIKKTVPKPSDCYELTTRYFNKGSDHLFDFCG